MVLVGTWNSQELTQTRNRKYNSFVMIFLKEDLMECHKSDTMERHQSDTMEWHQSDNLKWIHKPLFIVPQDMSTTSTYFSINPWSVSWEKLGEEAVKDLGITYVTFIINQLE